MDIVICSCFGCESTELTREGIVFSLRTQSEFRWILAAKGEVINVRIGMKLVNMVEEVPWSMFVIGVQNLKSSLLISI